MSRGLYIPGAAIAAKVSRAPAGFRRNGRAMWDRFVSEQRGGFVIPNEVDAGTSDQAAPDKVDLDILTAGLSHGTPSAGSYGAGPTGVQARTPTSNSPGCAVTAQGTPNMTVAVAAGTVRIGGRRVEVAAANVTITAADATNKRRDLIVVDTAGVKTAIAGTASDPTRAALPTITTGKVVLAAVTVLPAATSITANRITDKRVIIDEPPHENALWYGAVGNDSTDNATALQLAIDTAAADPSWGKGRTVFIPHGIYRTTVALVPKPGVKILGDGHPGIDSTYGTYISAATNGMTILNDPEGGSVDQHGWAVEHIGFIDAGTTGITCIKISGTLRWRITECVFSANAVGNVVTAIYLDAGAAGNLDNNWNKITRCEIRNIDIGVDGFVGVQMTDTHYVTAATQTTNAVGVRMKASGTDTAIHAQNGRIIGCEFVLPASGGIGVHSQGSFVDLLACHFESNTGNTNGTHIKIEKVVGSNSQAGTRHNIAGCSFTQTGTGINIGTGVTDTSITGIQASGITTFLVDSGSRTTYLPNGVGEIARLPTALDLPQVTAPASPGAGSHRFYVDTADTTFKSKDSTGKISVYGSRTRSLFIDASVLRVDAASGVKLGSPPNAVDGVSLVNGVTSGAYCNLIMPVDVITGLLKVRPIWVPSATDAVAHTVQWQMNIKIISGADVTAAGTSLGWTGASAARTVNVEVLEPGQDSTGVSPAADDRVRLEIQRLGANASDTYVGDVYLIGLRLDYLANN